MEPIISPWLVYLLGVVNGVSTTFVTIAVISGVILAILLLAGVIQIMIGLDYGEEDEDYIRGKACISAVKKHVWVFIVTLFLAVIIPSRNTIIGMIAAKNITRDNIASVIKAGKSVKDEIKSDIADIIKMLVNGGEIDRGK